MARSKPKLTWDAKSRRWKKVYRGEQIYLSPRDTSKSDSAAYRLALDTFEHRKAEIDARGKPHAEDYDWAIRLRQEIADWCAFEIEAGIETDAELMVWQAENEHASDWSLDLAEIHDRMVDEVRQLRTAFDRPKPPPLTPHEINPLSGLPMKEKQLWCNRIETLRAHQRWGQATDHGDTLEAHTAAYLDFKKQQVNSGELSYGRYDNIRHQLKNFRECVGGELDIANLNGKSLAQYHTSLLRAVETGDYSQTSAQDNLTTAKAFIKWLWQSEIIDTLPRNLDSLKIKSSPKAVKTLTTTEVKSLIDNCPDRLKCYLLLMLNTGMTQQDVSDLRYDEVDWQDGRVIRKRSKTKDNKNVPTVNYKLWAETFDLMKQFKSDNPDYVFRNADGGPLRFRGENENGKSANLDNIKSAYFRLQQKLKTQLPPLKLLRKTGASMLEQHTVYGRYAQHYLGHSPRSVADKSYIAPSPQQFDNAIQWLGQQFGLT